MRIKFIFLLLLVLPLAAQEAFSQISYWSDPFGNQGSFWKVVIQGRTHTVLKIKSPDKSSEANIVLDDALLADLEKRVGELRSRTNGLKADGFEVLWSAQAGEATVRTLLGRWHGVKVKVLQVEERQDERKSEHQVTLDDSYPDFQRALRKVKSR